MQPSSRAASHRPCLPHGGGAPANKAPRPAAATPPQSPRPRAFPVQRSRARSIKSRRADFQNKCQRQPGQRKAVRQQHRLRIHHRQPQQKKAGDSIDQRLPCDPGLKHAGDEQQSRAEFHQRILNGNASLAGAAAAPQPKPACQRDVVQASESAFRTTRQRERGVTID